MCINHDHVVLQWELFRLPELDYFDHMLYRVFKQELERIIVNYESYRMALHREMEKKLQERQQQQQTQISPIYQNVAELQENMASMTVNPGIRSQCRLLEKKYPY